MRPRPAPRGAARGPRDRCPRAQVAAASQEPQATIKKWGNVVSLHVFFSTRLRAGISYAPAAESVRSQAPSPPVGVLRKAFSFESVFRPPKPSAPPRRTSSRQTCGKGRGGQGGAGRRGAPRGTAGRLGARSRGRRPRGPRTPPRPLKKQLQQPQSSMVAPQLLCACVCVRWQLAGGPAASETGWGRLPGPPQCCVPRWLEVAAAWLRA